MVPKSEHADIEPSKQNVWFVVLTYSVRSANADEAGSAHNAAKSNATPVFTWMILPTEQKTTSLMRIIIYEDFPRT